MLFLSKLLPLFLYPLGLTLLITGIALVAGAFGFRRFQGGLILVSGMILWVASTPLAANWLTYQVEAQFQPRPVSEIPEVDVAIVLGGALKQPIPPRVEPDLGEAADRVLHAARLWEAGKVNQIVVSGGNLPWQQSTAPEAVLIADLLVEFGVPRERILVETSSRNTAENAERVAELWQERGFRTGLLVTSARHMKRALDAFQKYGLNLMPASTDVQATLPYYQSLLDLLPDAEALEMTSSTIKELVGQLVYRMRGEF